MATLLDILISIVGTPSNDLESLVLYMVVCLFGLFFILWVMWLFQLISSFINYGRR